MVFFGTSEFAVPALKYLNQNDYSIAAVITQPEKPVGRAKVVLPSPVKRAALEIGLHVHEPHNLKNDDGFLKNFIHQVPDICIIAAYGKIIPSSYLAVPRFGFINIHPSLLPKYRGPSPIQTAIMNGDDETGVSIMKIDEEVDHGPVLGSSKYQLESSKGYKEIEKELAELGVELLLETLPKYIAGEILPKEQDHDKATFTKLLKRDDGKIDWNRPAEEIFNKIRALSSEPGTWSLWKGKVFNIIGVELSDGLTDKEPGTIFSINGQIAVATSKCYLILKQIQLEGGKKMDAKSFVNGHPDLISSSLE